MTVVQLRQGSRVKALSRAGILWQAPHSSSSSQLWPRHRSWPQAEAAKTLEGERCYRFRRYNQGLANALLNLKVEVNICHLWELGSLSMPRARVSLNCHIQRGCSQTFLAFRCFVARGLAPYHFIHPSISTNTSPASTPHFLPQR